MLRFSPIPGPETASGRARSGLTVRGSWPGACVRQDLLRPYRLRMTAPSGTGH